jgi:Inner membrane protein YqiJ, N-terminal/Inner membrane protein YqiJ, OB-fold
MLFAAETWPFVVATLVLVLITAVEGVALLAGVSAFHWLDHLAAHSPTAEHGTLDKGLGWLQIGRVPMLALLVLFLAAFAVSGFAANLVAHRLFGSWLPAWISIPVALLAALPSVRLLGAAVARLVPADETFAVTLDSLVGRVATVLGGTARHGYPAEAKVLNQHGQTLYVMVEPDMADGVFEAGTSVLLVRQVAGNRFAGIPNPRPDLL